MMNRYECKYSIIHHIHVIGIYAFADKCYTAVILNLFGPVQLHKYEVRKTADSHFPPCLSVIVVLF